MEKRKSTWVSPKKQKEIDEKNRRDYKRNVIIAIIVCSLLVVAIASSVTGIVLASRPYYAFIEIAGYGTIVIELNDDEAPKTVSAFVQLAEMGHYDGTDVYRAYKDKYFQAGHRQGAVVGPIEGEFANNGHENNLSHMRGTISMSRQTGGENDKDYYNTASGQFFILQRDMPGMDGKYAAFGTVLEGMDVVDRICNEIEMGEGGTIPADKRPVIKSIRIERSYEK